MYQTGDIVLVKLPFTDLSQTKIRPTFVVTKLKANDLIVCQITSQPPRSYEIAIEITNTDMEEGNLAFNSYVRADKIFTIDQSIVVNKIGRLHSDKVKKVKEAIISLIG